MSRPKPTVLLEHTDNDTGKCEQVLEANGIYVLCYNGKPVSIKRLNIFFDYPGPKYQKTMFPNPAHAQNLADRLNKRYDTDKFTVKEFQA